jgi:hypothetical protein
VQFEVLKCNWALGWGLGKASCRSSIPEGFDQIGGSGFVERLRLAGGRDHEGHQGRLDAIPDLLTGIFIYPFEIVKY